MRLPGCSPTGQRTPDVIRGVPTHPGAWAADGQPGLWGDGKDGGRAPGSVAVPLMSAGAIIWIFSPLGALERGHQDEAVVEGWGWPAPDRQRGDVTT